MTALVIRVSITVGELWQIVLVCLIAGAAIGALGTLAYQTRAPRRANR